MRLLALGVLLLSLQPLTLQAATDGEAPGAPRSGWSFEEMAHVPVQSGGRIKPLDSFAREIVLFETGSRNFEGWDPVDLLLSWVSFPKAWQDKAFLQITRKDVKRQLVLDENRSRFSPAELFQSVALAQYADELARTSAQPKMGEPKPSPREQELRRVLDRIGMFRNIVSGEGWPLVPSEKPSDPWKSLATQDKSVETIREPFAHALMAYRNLEQNSFKGASAETRAAVEKSVRNWDSSMASKLSIEVTYNRWRPFLFAWILFVAASLAWIVLLAIGKTDKFAAKLPAWILTWAAAACLVVGIAMRCYIAGRPPVSNMYESIIWVSLGVFGFALIIYFFTRQVVLLSVASALTAFGLVAADSAPAMMDPGLHPLVPVLRSNYWLTIHVLTITLGYAAFALSLGIANVTLFHYLRKKPGSTAKIFNLNQLTYRAMQFGVVLLAAGTILGGIWADYSWGRFWGWDPKETWALIALLCYLAILHGRYSGWVGQFGFAAWSVVSFLSVVMAWYGVNFVLGVGLHSYGFSSGGGGWVFGFTALQLAYVGVVAVFRKKSQVLAPQAG